MSSSPEFDARIDILDVIINALKEHERRLNEIVERFETAMEKGAVGSEVGESIEELGRGRGAAEAGERKEGVIFVSGRKILLIPEEDLPKLLGTSLSLMAEYDLDTPEKRSALERFFSMLNRKNREKMSY